MTHDNKYIHLDLNATQILETYKIYFLVKNIQYAL